MTIQTMIYLYVATGLTILCLVYFINREEKPSAWAKDVLNAINPRTKTLKDYLSDILVYTIAILVIMFAWPAFLIWIAYESYSTGGLIARLLGNKKYELINYPFKCRPENLTSVISPIDAEKEGQIHDPLNTTPSEAFGYLHTTWIEFLSGHGFEETLWKFEINPNESTYRNKRYSGYAWVKSKKVVGEFLVEC
jgi:hypothetical protein